MQSTRVSTCLALAVVLALAAGCSSGPSIPGIDGLFGDNCNPCAPTPVAQAPCDPVPVAQTPCDPAPVCGPVAQPVAVDQGVRPPDARAGEVWCYVRVPAQTRQVEERVLVRAASTRNIPIPAVTKQVARQVCTLQPSQRRIDIPAEFNDVPEKVCTAQGRTEWQKVNCNPTKLAAREQVGECWTLVQVPAQFSTRMNRVCVRQASCRTEEVPGQYETRYETVVVTPASSRCETTPAQFENRLKTIPVCGPRWEWRRTTECEVPEEAGMGMGAAPMGNDLPAMEPAPFDAPVGNPDDDLPPAGGGALPPLR